MSRTGMGHDGGLFAPDALIRHVQAHHVVGQTYGQRALVLGATNPVPYIGTSSSTLAKERPFTRLAVTAKAFETVILGTRADAERVLARVHHMHTRVRGTLPEQAGLHPAGTPYDAFDPELMLWTMGVLADSSRRSFEAFVRPLDTDERDALWQDWITFGTLFGMPRDVAPRTAADFDDWMAEHLTSDRFHVTPEARAVGRAIVTAMPVPARMRPGVRATNFTVIGLLPPRVRDAFGLGWGRGHQRVHDALAASLWLSSRTLPARVRLGTNARLLDIVIRSEAEVVARGGRTMPTLEAPTLEAPTLEAPTLEAPTLEAPTLDAPP
ncbi:oxygenase MpaB family protein [Nocardioides yefusunii]|uniref:Oxygenase MpaB family protein n=1 Tax=Nocardioides yefusunii TaxID=2500546 RepID=A0ABW1QV24_9ACTN|nr:oxygenase MpaB family protein [Nocardioides yefusunii]